MCVCFYACVNNPSWCNVLVQVAIAAGESFFPSKARIVVAVAAEVEKQQTCCSQADTFCNIGYQVDGSERSLQRWLKTFEEQGVMISSRRGQHAKTVSPIVDPDFRAQFISQVKNQSCKKGTYMFNNKNLYTEVCVKEILPK